MRIFITGINGVLGSVLKDVLRANGHYVAGCALTHSEDPQIVRGDISERRQLDAALGVQSSWDVLVHFAAEFGRKNGQDFYEQLWKSNCLGTRNVIDACVQRGIKLVFASSSEAYGLSEEYARGKEIAEDVLDKYVPMFHNEYALSKYTNERQIFTAARNHGLEAVILRFFNIYGPPERYTPYRSVVCQLIYQMLANIPVTVNSGGYRTHLWIGDWARTVTNVVEGFTPVLASHKGKIWPGAAGTPNVPVFNVGGTEFESIAALYRRLTRIIPNSKSVLTLITSEQANSPAKKPDNTLAKYWLNHDPKTLLDEGLRRTIEWTKKEYGF